MKIETSVSARDAAIIKEMFENGEFGDLVANVELSQLEVPITANSEAGSTLVLARSLSGAPETAPFSTEQFLDESNLAIPHRDARTNQTHEMHAPGESTNSIDDLHEDQQPPFGTFTLPEITDKILKEITERYPIGSKHECTIGAMMDSGEFWAIFAIPVEPIGLIQAFVTKVKDNDKIVPISKNKNLLGYKKNGWRVIIEVSGYKHQRHMLKKDLIEAYMLLEPPSRPD